MKPRVYSGFPLVMETEIDGFIYGEITDHFDFEDDEEGCTSGDGFVQAPNGTRAGIIWDVIDEPYLSICIEPEKDRWGVYNVGFVRPIKTMDDLVYNFKTIFPLIKEAYNKSKLGK
ncbi:3-deoxy-8-phosphooctulonate synthase [Bacillus sp. 7884-1]|uniref:3-deoxy-8-phosphooctulonate synthase n=1 Tax=Bacillus sp. 7884-1 TaxID=2021693 RepID=UPI000BA5D0BE|nr:3-deoxy-8-phosphooctulonate synthase [Bacillus sp. 7884-1]PAE42784.1 3-deoxy-8-phosphooctulonate synthase [Bacillus sp. 7884-1]